MFGRLTKLPFKVAHSLARRIQEKEEARQAELLAERGAEESAEAARSGPPIPTRELAELSADEVSMSAADALAEGVSVVDVRRQAAGDAPAVPEATRIPLEDLMIRLAELPAGARLVTLDETGEDALTAALFLRNRGFEQVFALRGGLAAWRAAGGETAGG
ncbi:MAG: rhodanese-like domain-containing protein [Alphaproteobacteria bacterium]|nr:rhodanese-like domain-containing protein [Alphaproteobacteria bacterium]MCB9791447.1 rhodanese-like domain-containing protein [Alphaproteobacteria bacterium]